LKENGATIYEVAAAADVSIGTVSNFINRPEIVAEKTRARIDRAIRDLNFKPNLGAAILGGKAARMIGLVLSDVRNPFFTDVARGAEDTARERDHLTVLCNSDGDEDRELQYIRSLEDHRVTGILLSPVNEHSSALLEVQRRGTPLVLVGRSSQNFCCATTDNDHGGELVGDHLMDLGHREIAFVCGPLHTTQYFLRLQGLRRAVEQRQAPAGRLSVHIVPGLGTMSEGQAAVAPLLALRPRPTAISCGNDLLALGVFSGLVRAGVRIPDDISLVGYDDLELADQGFTSLTTVRQPKLELGRVATQLLLEELRECDAHVHRQIQLRPRLIVRETTSPCGS
jgi:LacI family transcriptional regulator